MANKNVTLDSAVMRESLIMEKSEMSQVFEHLDDDSVDSVTKMSTMDTNARLSANRISSVLRCDELMRAGIYPADLGISRQLKRLSVSLDGKGREEKVRIAEADRSQKSGSSGWQGLANLFKPRE